MAGKAVITKETEAARKKVWSRKAGWATFFISESADEYVDPNAKGKGQAEKAADQGADNNANANANAVGNAANANDNGNAAPVNANENAAPVNANVNAAPVNANVNAAQANDNGNEEKKQENKEADIKDKDRYIIVDQVGDKGAGYKDLFNHLSDKKCCYILYDHVSTGKLNRKLEKQYFIFWSPPNVDQMEKMAYSAYLINCRDDLKFSHHETIKGEDDIEDFVQNKLGEKADDDDDGDDDDDWI